MFLKPGLMTGVWPQKRPKTFKNVFLFFVSHDIFSFLIIFFHYFSSFCFTIEEAEKGKTRKKKRRNIKKLSKRKIKGKIRRCIRKNNKTHLKQEKKQSEQ